MRAAFAAGGPGRREDGAAVYGGAAPPHDIAWWATRMKVVLLIILPIIMTEIVVRTERKSKAIAHAAVPAAAVCVQSRAPPGSASTRRHRAAPAREEAIHDAVGRGSSVAEHKADCFGDASAIRSSVASGGLNDNKADSSGFAPRPAAHHGNTLDFQGFPDTGMGSCQEIWNQGSRPEIGDAGCI